MGGVSGEWVLEEEMGEAGIKAAVCPIPIWEIRAGAKGRTSFTQDPGAGAALGAPGAGPGCTSGAANMGCGAGAGEGEGAGGGGELPAGPSRPAAAAGCA